MIVPGCTYNSVGRVDITSGPGTVPNRFHGGFGFMTDGSLAMDTDAAAGNFYTNGFRQSAAGAIYHFAGVGTVNSNGGYRMSATDQLCTSTASPDTTNSLDGFVATSGRLATF